MREQADRIIVARLSGAAGRLASRPGDEAAAVAELREIAGGRADLLAHVAGLALGSVRLPADEPVRRRVAELCVLAGADEALIPHWEAVGRERARSAWGPPFSSPG